MHSADNARKPPNHSGRTRNKQANAECPNNGSQRKRKGIRNLPTISLAMVTHIIQRCVQKLPASPSRPFVVDLHVHRHLKHALAHVLTIPLHLLKLCLHPALLAWRLRLPMLPIELQLHLVHAVKIRVHTKAYSVKFGMRRRIWHIRSVCPRITVLHATNHVLGDGLRSLPSPGTPLRIRLPYLFLLCPRKILAYVALLHEPIVIVPTNVRSVALISFRVRPR